MRRFNEHSVPGYRITGARAARPRGSGAGRRGPASDRAGVRGGAPAKKEVTVARTSWFDEKAEHPLVQEQVTKLESFTAAMADGIVSKQEVTGQEQRLVA